MKRGFGAAALLFLISTGAGIAAEPPAPFKIIEITGHAEILYPGEGRWKPLTRLASLRRGCKIRTKAESSVQLALDPEYISMAKLPENSRLDISLGRLPGLVLQKGGLFVVRENEGSGFSKKEPIRLFTPKQMIVLEEGGLELEASSAATRIKVFSQKAAVYDWIGHESSNPRVIEEGFKFYSDASGIQWTTQRLSYGDYSGWKTWITQFYKHQDAASQGKTL